MGTEPKTLYLEYVGQLYYLNKLHNSIPYLCIFSYPSYYFNLYNRYAININRKHDQQHHLCVKNRNTPKATEHLNYIGQ